MFIYFFISTLIMNFLSSTDEDRVCVYLEDSPIKFVGRLDISCGRRQQPHNLVGASGRMVLTGLLTWLGKVWGQRSGF